MDEQRKLYRSRKDRVISGVCGGLGEYFGIDPVFVRLIALALLFAGGSAFIIYIVMAIIVPEEPESLGATAGSPSAAPKAPPVPSDPGASAAAASPAPAPAVPTATSAAPETTTTFAEAAPKAASRAGLIGGLILIGIGVVFLLARFVPGIAWWSAWPLIIVLVGVIQCVTPGRNGWDAERFFGGLGTIAAGLLLLGNVTGYISWRAWWVLISLWPLLLVSIGLSLLAKGLGQTWLRAAGSLLILGAFVYASAVSWTGTGNVPVTSAWTVDSVGKPYSFVDTATGISSARFKLEGGGANIEIGSGSSLVSVDGTSQFGEPRFSSTKSGDKAEVRLATASEGSVVVGPGVVGQDMKVKLGTEPAWNVDLSTGAAALNADLSGLKLSAFTLSTGVSSSKVKLGSVSAGGDPVPVVVKSGLGAVEILVPEGTAARLDIDQGLSGTNIGSGFARVGDHWETPGYSSAGTGYEIRIESGIGSIAVDTY